MKGVKEVEPSAENKIIELAELKIDSCIAVCAPAGTCGKEPFKCILKDDLSLVFDSARASRINVCLSREHRVYGFE